MKGKNPGILFCVGWVGIVVRLEAGKAGAERGLFYWVSTPMDSKKKYEFWINFLELVV